jgi:ABC-type lipoprotein release transport system permease subunit
VSAVARVAASQLRRNRRSSALIALLLAVTVAIVLAAVAGARRTDSAVDEFVAADKGADAYAAFNPPEFGGSASPDLQAEAATVGAYDGVTRTARFSFTTAELVSPTISGGHLAVFGYISIDPDGLAMVGRFRVVDGRLADQARPGELMIDEELARDAGLSVGSRLGLRAYTREQVFADASARAEGVQVDAEIVGIVRRPIDLRDAQERQRPNDYVTHHQIYLTAGFWEAAAGDVASPNPFVAFDVEDGTDLSALLLQLSEEADAYAVDHARFLELDGTFNGVGRSASLHSRALQAFAAVLALAGLFLVGQTLGRQMVLEARDHPTLRALGLTPRQLRQAAVLRAAPVAVVGAAVGVIGAVALSPLAPLPETVARRAELHTGVSVDLPVLIGGAVLAAFLAVLASALPSTRAVAQSVDDRGGRDRPSLASRLAARGLSAPATIGVRFALEPGRGRTAVPVRTAIVTAVTSVAIVLAAITFTASLSGTREHSRRYGVTWDVAAGAMTSPEEAVALADQVRDIPGVAAFSAMGATAFDTPFGEISSVMVRQEEGQVTPLITDGRAPGPGEVALGVLTMEEEDLRIGDELSIVDPIAGSRDFRITGTVVLNVAGVDVSIAPGRGALFDWSVLELLNPEQAGFIAPQIFLVDAEPGRTPEVEEQLTALFPTSTSATPIEPLDLINLGDASLLPSALGLVVGVLGIGTVAHTLLSAIRRRERELAVLKTIGFVRAETRRAVAWQAITFGAVALVGGVPVGVAGGRLAWSVAADQLGIPSHPVVSPATVALIGVGFLVLLVLTAIVPAQLASRIPAADVLRRD